jgi:hypothetical protein
VLAGADPAAGRGPRERSRRLSVTGTCSARCDCDEQDAAHACAAWRTSHPWPWQLGGGGYRVAWRHGNVTGTGRACSDRNAPKSAHTCAAANATLQVWHKPVPPGAHPAAGHGRQGRSCCMSGAGACSARSDCNAPDAAHACAAWRTSRCRPRLAGGCCVVQEALGCARLAATATCQMRHTLVMLEHIPPPALAGGGGLHRVAIATSRMQRTRGLFGTRPATCYGRRER